MSNPRTVVPLTPQAVAARIAAAGLALATDLCTATDRVAVRLGVDGPVREDTRRLGDLVAEQVRASAAPVAQVHADDFLRARSLRLEFGVDAEAYLDRWYDLAALSREVLEPLGPSGTGRYLPRLRDASTDRPYRARTVTAAPGTVLVVDGRFLGRWELSGDLDLHVLLDVSPAARARRLPDAERDPVNRAWQAYLDGYDPAARAGFVVRFDHPDRPALVTPASG